MNNWEARKEIIAFVSDELGTAELEKLANEYGKGTARSIIPNGATKPIYFFAHRDLDDIQIVIAFDCLQDHMDNVDVYDWCREIEDILCEDGMYRTTYNGTYHGQAVDIDTTVIQM